MAKRYTDTTIWTKQRWFKKLDPIHKLAWKYITDTCDHAGILKIDFSEFIDDLGIEEFDIMKFLDSCNIEFDKDNGKKIFRERIKLVRKNVFWITGFIKFQYENKEFLINPSIPAVYSALTILNGYGILEEGLNKGYITLSKPYSKGMLTTKDKDKDKDKDKEINNESTIEKTFLCKEIIRVYKEKNPTGPVPDDFRDLMPAQDISSYIFKNKKFQGDYISNQKNIIFEWEIICDWISKDPFYCQKGFKTLSNSISEIFNKTYNGDKSKQDKRNSSNSKTAGIDHAITSYLQAENAKGNTGP